eukprot:354241-Chlamydomonas_euryale.AAC.1
MQGKRPDNRYLRQQRQPRWFTTTDPAPLPPLSAPARRARGPLTHAGQTSRQPLPPAAAAARRSLISGSSSRSRGYDRQLPQT